MKYCDFCCNATVEPELTSDSDLSYMSIGECSAGYSMCIRSGAGLPTAIVVSKWLEGVTRNADIGEYIPKFCPECGRKLLENKKAVEKVIQRRNKQKVEGSIKL